MADPEKTRPPSKEAHAGTKARKRIPKKTIIFYLGNHPTQDSYTRKKPSRGRLGETLLKSTWNKTNVFIGKPFEILL